MTGARSCIAAFAAVMFALLLSFAGVFGGEAAAEETTTEYMLKNAVKTANSSVKLNNDVELSEGLLVKAKNVTIDLNGHRLYRKLTNGSASGYVIKINVSCSLTVNDTSPEGNGEISGGFLSSSAASIYAAGVSVANGAVFTLNNGHICGNTYKNYGGGVGVYEKGTFNMNGGVIEGNSGNGVYIYDKSAKFIVSGSPVIRNNSDSNTVLDNKAVITPGELADGAFLSVSGTKETAVAAACDTDHSQYFHPDNEELCAVYDPDKKTIKLAEKTDISGEIVFSKTGGVKYGDTPLTENRDYTIAYTDSKGKNVKSTYPGIVNVTVTGIGTYKGTVGFTAVNNAVIAYNWEDEDTCRVTVSSPAAVLEKTFDAPGGVLDDAVEFDGDTIELKAVYSTENTQGVQISTEIRTQNGRTFPVITAAYKQAESEGDVYVTVIGFDLVVTKNGSETAKHFERSCEAGTADYTIVLGGTDITAVSGSAFVVLSDGETISTAVNVQF